MICLGAIAQLGERCHGMAEVVGSSPTSSIEEVPMRTLQEWMGHRDLATKQRYADYAPNEREVGMVDRAFEGPKA